MTQAEFEHEAEALRRLSLQVAAGMKCMGDEAEDVAQDSMIRLWLLHAEVRTTVDARRLLTVITRHIIIDMRRARGYACISIDSHKEDTGSPSPHETLENKEWEEWLARRIRRLPKTEYQILHLRQEEHLENEQIAALLGTTVASVATLLSRSRKRLLEEIKSRNNQ